MAAIGIDLGTTNTCVAVVREGEVEVLKNERNHCVTPSCVAFRDTNAKIGEAGIYLLGKESACGNVVYGIKRIIGRRFDEEYIRKQGWPFKVTKDIDEMSAIEVKRYGKNEKFRPSEISALVLREMKSIAEKRLGRKVTDAVITVPAQFTVLQRVETETAAKIAGLNVIGMINEPTAAALAYGISQSHLFSIFAPKRYALVYDFGGGTFDVAVMEIKGGCFRVIGYAGDLHLGGNDITNNLAKHFADLIGFKRVKGHNVNDEHTWRELVNRAEEVKIELSFEPCAPVKLGNCSNSKSVDTKFDRTKLTELNNSLYDKTFRCIEEALRHAGIEKEEIHDVVLAGGSSRIPFLQQRIARHFATSTIHSDINQDEIVARGAAIYAAQLSGFATRRMSKLKYVEVTSHSLGTDVMCDKTSTIIEINSQLPAEAVKTYANVVNNQTSLQISVCQGEDETFSKNDLIDTFDLPIRPDQAGKVKVEVKFRLDTNGMLSITAREKKYLPFLAKEEKFEINLRGAFREQQIADQIRRLNIFT